MTVTNKDQIRLKQLYSVCRAALTTSGLEDISTINLLKAAVGLVIKTKDKSGLIDEIIEELLKRDIQKEILFGSEGEEDEYNTLTSNEVLTTAVKILIASDQKEDNQKTLVELKEEIASNKKFDTSKTKLKMKVRPEPTNVSSPYPTFLSHVPVVKNTEEVKEQEKIEEVEEIDLYIGKTVMGVISSEPSFAKVKPQRC